jgi:hypothetical protein
LCQVKDAQASFDVTVRVHPITELQSLIISGISSISGTVGNTITTGELSCKTPGTGGISVPNVVYSIKSYGDQSIFNPSIDPTTGKMTGTPSAPGTGTITISATYKGSEVYTDKEVAFDINNAPPTSLSATITVDDTTFTPSTIVAGEVDSAIDEMKIVIKDNYQDLASVTCAMADSTSFPSGIQIEEEEDGSA